MALTTVNPSPASGMWRSESNTSNFSVAMRCRAWFTVEVGITSKPRFSRPSLNTARMSALSSTRRTRFVFATWYTPSEGELLGNKKPVQICTQVLFCGRSRAYIYRKSNLLLYFMVQTGERRPARVVLLAGPFVQERQVYICGA